MLTNSMQITRLNTTYQLDRRPGFWVVERVLFIRKSKERIAASGNN
jgi:hypothetical protein